MLVETARQSVDSVVDYVERTVYKTCERFQFARRLSRPTIRWASCGEVAIRRPTRSPTTRCDTRDPKGILASFLTNGV
jgi:hypothetical protein